MAKGGGGGRGGGRAAKGGGATRTVAEAQRSFRNRRQIQQLESERKTKIRESRNLEKRIGTALDKGDIKAYQKLNTQRTILNGQISSLYRRVLALGGYGKG